MPACAKKKKWKDGLESKLTQKIKQNTKALIGGGVVLIALAWFLGIWLPGRNMDNDRRCSIDGLNFGRGYQRDLEVSTPEADRHWARPLVHYNRKMNTCLVEVQWDEMIRSRDELGQFGIIVDAYANHTIVSTLTDGQEKYDTERKKLFSE